MRVGGSERDPHEPASLPTVSALLRSRDGTVVTSLRRAALSTSTRFHPILRPRFARLIAATTRQARHGHPPEPRAPARTDGMRGWWPRGAAAHIPDSPQKSRCPCAAVCHGPCSEPASRLVWTSTASAVPATMMDGRYMDGMDGARAAFRITSVWRRVARPTVMTGHRSCHPPRHTSLTKPSCSSYASLTCLSWHLTRCAWLLPIHILAHLATVFGRQLSTHDLPMIATPSPLVCVCVCVCMEVETLCISGPCARSSSKRCSLLPFMIQSPTFSQGDAFSAVSATAVSEAAFSDAASAAAFPAAAFFAASSTAAFSAAAFTVASFSAAGFLG